MEWSYLRCAWVVRVIKVIFLKFDISTKSKREEINCSAEKVEMVGLPKEDK